jgi:organic hydroperoxide reductase OsmC/OhrA
MSEHRAQIDWVRSTDEFGPTYSRAHVWRFDGGIEVAASSAPGLFGNPGCVDPEEAFVAAISSCHMLWFLHLAEDTGNAVERYVDNAVGTMARNEAGTICITHVDLRPVIGWVGAGPRGADIEALHHESHNRCFIANSVRTKITVFGS